MTEDLTAKSIPNGWVYRIEGRFAPNEAVTPEAIVGAWTMDENDNILGEFIPTLNTGSAEAV
jgi:hypothetical protein